MVKGLELGNELPRERGGCQCKSLLLCVRTKRDNILCELCVFAPLAGGTIYGQLAEQISNAETCSNLQIVVIRLSGAQHPLSSALLMCSSPVPRVPESSAWRVIGICSRSISTWGANIRNATSKIALDIEVWEIPRLKEERQRSKICQFKGHQFINLKTFACSFCL